MHGDESGDAQRGGWQLLEHVSPWTPASGPEHGLYWWVGYGAPPPARPRPGLGRRIAYVAVAVAVLAAGAGAAVSIDHWSGALAALGGSASPSSPAGQGRTDGDAGSLDTSALETSALAARVDPGIVDIINSSLGGDENGAGTGMVISPSGLVLTNNHVIDGAASVSATLVTTGMTYTARVVGYDSTDDVALLQLVGASGLTPVTLSDSGKAKVGEAVLALGNAGGKGGLPATARGAIEALDQTIEVGDSQADATELHGMIAMDAPIRPGDSGGPLVNGDGAVVGMDTAGDAAGSDVNFAIPINAAMSIVSQIRSGKASATVHLGLAAYLGVNAVDASSRHPCASGSDGLGFAVSSPVSSGALICETDPYGPASQISTGLETGDVIVSVNGKTIGSAADLTALTAAAHPGDTFAIDYVDPDGAVNSVSVTLTGWAR
jgi:S1-C subfamily serine protease